MYEDDETGLEFMEVFLLVCMVLWIGGAALVMALVMMGGARV